MDTIARERLTYIGKTTFRRQGKLFGIREPDRFSHLYLVGRTGTGKSTLLGTMALQDLAAGRGIALLDPHGDLVEEILCRLPLDRRDYMLYLDAPDATATWAYNPLGGVAPERRGLAVSGLVEVFRRLWHDDWGPRLEHLLRNVLLTLLELPDGNLGDVPRLLADKDFRRDALRHVENPEVRSFWTTEPEDRRLAGGERCSSGGRDDSRGARVDVGIETDEESFAVEVEMGEGHAVENVRKDLEAGYSLATPKSSSSSMIPVP